MSAVVKEVALQSSKYSESDCHEKEYLSNSGSRFSNELRIKRRQYFCYIVHVLIKS